MRRQHLIIILHMLSINKASPQSDTSAGVRAPQTLTNLIRATCSWLPVILLCKWDASMSILSNRILLTSRWSPFASAAL